MFQFKIFFLALGLSLSASAQLPEGPNRLYEGEGRLVIFRIVPGDKGAKLFWVGRKVADVDFRKNSRLISIVARKGDVQEELHFIEQGKTYLIPKFPDSPDWSFTLKAEIRGERDGAEVRLKKP
jgi:hypothetical protein